MKRSSLVNLSPSILQPVLMHLHDSIITQVIGTNKKKPLTNWNRNSLPPFLTVKTLDLTFSTSSQNKVDWKKIIINLFVCFLKQLVTPLMSLFNFKWKFNVWSMQIKTLNL